MATAKAFAGIPMAKSIKQIKLRQIKNQSRDTYKNQAARSENRSYI
jgi:hypothetical protein